jgi:GNAT superfamily N-acetyltransferase
MPDARFRIFQYTDVDLADLRMLMREYAGGLGVDLCFQDFETELRELPGAYALPSGALLIARDADGAAGGCVAVKPLAIAGCCELKRLYVRPEARGAGLGQRLLDAALGEARSRGYSTMLLDTLPEMVDAQRLYARNGFTSAPAYYGTPVAGTVFLSRALR